jgi:hypothetical protein
MKTRLKGANNLDCEHFGPSIENKLCQQGGAPFLIKYMQVFWDEPILIRRPLALLVGMG